MKRRVLHHLVPTLMASFLMCCVSVSVGQEDANQDAFFGTYGVDPVLDLPSGAQVARDKLFHNWADAGSVPGVVVSWWKMDDAGYFTRPLAMRADLQCLGDRFLAWAATQDRLDQHRLYVVVEDPGLCSFTYQYEHQQLHLPEGYELLREMIWTFGTVDFDDVASTDTGRVFLLEHGLATCEGESLAVDLGEAHAQFNSALTVFVVGDTLEWYRPSSKRHMSADR